MGSLLSEFTETKKQNGFLAFQRLVGTLYFKKHYAAMASRKDVQTPQQLPIRAAWFLPKTAKILALTRALQTAFCDFLR